jgi:hypothetical protein
VDVQSSGANVFLPGTQRPKYAGRGYTIVMDNLEALADGGDPVGAVIFANWVADNRPGSGETFTPSAPWDGTTPDQRQTAYLASVLGNQAAEVAETAPGTRNHRLFIAALKCGNYVAGAGMDEPAVIQQLTEAATRGGLELRESRATIASGLRVGRRRPRAVPDADVNPFGGLVETSIADGSGTFAEEEETDSDRIRRRFPRLPWHELWADEVEEEWIVEPLLAVGRSIAIYSAPKVGKSLLILEIAAGIATGCEVIGTRPKPRRVLYVDFENDPRVDVRDRLQRLGYSPGDLDNLVYLSFPVLSPLDTAIGAAELLAAVQ